MNPSVELSAIRLILDASLFTKAIMLLLGCISVVSWAIMIHKFIFISAYRQRITKYARSLSTQGRLSAIEDATLPYTTGIAKTMPVLVVKLIRLRGQRRTIPAPETVVNNAQTHEMASLQRSMGVLALSANVSPLVGLLGTVWGIMYSFINISGHASASIDVVAPGIAEALITTIAGLVVAIPAMVGHNLLSGMINTCLDSLDRISEFARALFSYEES